MSIENIVYEVSNGNKKVSDLTKREYLAGLAMQGHIANSNESMIYEAHEGIANLSVSYADALLKELDK